MACPFLIRKADGVHDVADETMGSIEGLEKFLHSLAGEFFEGAYSSLLWRNHMLNLAAVALSQRSPVRARPIASPVHQLNVGRLPLAYLRHPWRSLMDRRSP